MTDTTLLELATRLEEDVYTSADLLDAAKLLRKHAKLHNILWGTFGTIPETTKDLAALLKERG